jgi:hypothetical protein
MHTASVGDEVIQATERTESHQSCQQSLFKEKNAELNGTIVIA